MLDGLTLTVVGMLAVFAFLGILVLAMTALRVFVARLPQGRPPEEGESRAQPADVPPSPEGAVLDLDRVAAAVAAFHADRARTGRSPGGGKST